MQQVALSSERGIHGSLPPQLVAFALGIPAEKPGLNKHLIDPRRILTERELIASVCSRAPFWTESSHR